MNLKDFIADLERKIQNAYAEGTSVVQAEQLAGEFLYAQMVISSSLKSADLDSRMKKTGLKAVQAAVYTELIAGADKKPTESQLEQGVNMNDLVQHQRNELDTAEVERDELLRLYNIFREAHIHFRGISKGKFD